jgi:hypothetical protein
MRFTFSLALCLFAAGLVRGGQILVNPGFESGALGPWAEGTVFSGSEAWNVTNAVAHSGSFSATDVGNRQLRQNFAAVAGSTITDISFWAEHPDASVNALAFDLYYSDSTSNEFAVNTSGTGWNFFDVFVDLNTTKSLTGFAVFGNGLGRTYFDDASITTSASPEPASLLFMGTGVIGLLALRRLRKSE